jgi:hypothetical protein
MTNIEINISELDKAEVLAALYNASKPLGMGMLQFEPENMTADEARKLLSQHTYFDYLKGRVMKIDLSGDILNTEMYDRDNGRGAACDALNHLMSEVAQRK